MPKFNKKQRDYLDKVVKESSTRMILSERLFSVHSTVEDDVMKLGKDMSVISSLRFTVLRCNNTIKG